MAIHPTGSTRKLDKLGRVIIPVDIREAMRLKEGEMMEVFVDVDNNGQVVGVYFAKYARGCHFCGSLNDVRIVMGKPICATCRDAIGNV